MKKRICFYAVATELGGAERSLIELVKGLKSSEDWEPVVLLPKGSGPLLEELKRHGIEMLVEEFPVAFLKISRKNPWSVFFLLWSFPQLFRYLGRAGTLLRKNTIALLHTTGIKCHLLGVLIGKTNHIPVLIHLRDILRPGLTRYILQRLFRFSGVHLVANSQVTSAPFLNQGKIVSVVYNGINPEEFQENRNTRYGEAPVVGIVGTFTEWKGQKEFIRAAKILSDRKINARFVIVGARIYDTDAEAGYDAELRALVKSLGMEERIHFPGFEKDSAQIMNGIQILVHASTKPEPFGRVIIEAMACKTSVVASKWGAAPEIFTHDREGLIVDPKNPVEIADAVQSLLNDQEKANAMKSAARGLVVRNFSHTEYVKRMEKVFGQVVGA